MINRNDQRIIRKLRIRKRISGTSEVPRLSIFKSNRYIYAEAVDDEKSATLCSASDLKIKKGKRSEKAEAVGEEIAQKCLKKKITKVVFDRGGYKYTGLIKILAEAARKKGLKF